MTRSFTSVEQTEIWEAIKEGVIRGTIRTHKDAMNAAIVLRTGFVCAYSERGADLVDEFLDHQNSRESQPQELRTLRASGHRDPASPSFAEQRTDPSLPQEGSSD